MGAYEEKDYKDYLEIKKIDVNPFDMLGDFTSFMVESEGKRFEYISIDGVLSVRMLINQTRQF